jgi:hypothetical protein
MDAHRAAAVPVDVAIAVAAARVLEAQLVLEILEIGAQRSRLRGMAADRRRQLELLRALIGSTELECGRWRPVDQPISRSGRR